MIQFSCTLPLKTSHTAYDHHVSSDVLLLKIDGGYACTKEKIYVQPS